MKKIMTVVLLIVALLVAGCGSSDDAAVKICKDYIALCEKMDNGTWVDEDRFYSYFAKGKSGSYVTEAMSEWQVMTRRVGTLSKMGMSATYDVSDVNAVKVGEENGYEGYRVDMNVKINVSDGSKAVVRYTFVVISPTGKNQFKIQEVLRQRVG